jgi:cytochrome c oxidase subunit 4
MHPSANPLRAYLAVFGALIGLTLLTVGVAFINLGFFNTFVALGVACTKAFLVVYFFMHVRESSPLTKLFAAAGFLWVAILIVITVSDYFTRRAVENPVTRPTQLFQHPTDARAPAPHPSH